MQKSQCESGPRPPSDKLRPGSGRSEKAPPPTALRFLRKVLTTVRHVSLVFTAVLFATLRNGSVAWWNLLLWVWLGRVERHKVREVEDTQNINCACSPSIRWRVAATRRVLAGLVRYPAVLSRNDLLCPPCRLACSGRGLGD